MSIATATIKASELETEVMEVFALNEVSTIWVDSERGATNTIRAMIWEPVQPLHKVATKIAGCFCRDYQLIEITAAGNGFIVTLIKVDILPAAHL